MMALPLAQAFRQAGGRAWLVGGAVRDFFLAQCREVQMETGLTDAAAILEAVLEAGKSE